MTALAAWDTDDETVVRVDLTDPWTWKEYDRAIDQACELIKTVDHLVDLIINLTDSQAAPAVQSLRHFQRTLSLMPENTGLMVAAGGDPFTSGLFASFMKTQLANSLVQARAMLVNRGHLGTPASYPEVAAK